MTYFHSYSTDDDFAKAGLFLLAHKRDLHPSYTTLEMVTLLYSYVTQGHLFFAADDDNRVIGVAAYYCGTPDREFQDKDVALVDVAIVDKEHRGSRLFIKGLLQLVNTIIERHPEVRELRLAALADNGYLCRLYAKFTSTRSVREGTHGQEIVFHEKINSINDRLKKYLKV